ncbi:hypothetical protein [Haladaptatus sp. NG-SE-30]
MWYDFRFRAYPDRTGVTAEAERHNGIHRQASNHIRNEYNTLDTGTRNIGSAYQHQKRLPEWNDEWSSSAAQFCSPEISLSSSSTVGPLPMSLPRV